MTKICISQDKTNLSLGNQALRDGCYSDAVHFFELALKDNLSPRIIPQVEFNLEFALSQLEADSVAQNQVTEALSDYNGHIDITDYQCSCLTVEGWVTEVENKSTVFELVISIDNAVYSKVSNDIKRSDLVALDLSNGLGGFSFQIPRGLFSESPKRLDIQLPNGELLYSTLIHDVDFPAKALPDYRQPMIFSEVGQLPSVLVFVVFDSKTWSSTVLDQLLMLMPCPAKVHLTCLDSDHHQTDNFARLLKRYNNICYQNISSTTSVLHYVDSVLNEHPGMDMVFINESITVSPRWLEGLQRAMSTDCAIATVSPYSEVAYQQSVSSGQLESSSVDPLTFRRFSQGLYPSIPIALIDLGCLYVRRFALDALGGLNVGETSNLYESIQVFCLLARDQGYRHVLDDRTLVNNGLSNAQEYLPVKNTSEEIAKSFEFFQRGLAGQTIASIYRYAEALLNKDIDNKERVLFVISTQTGGTPQTNKDLMAVLADQVEPWLLQCDQQQMSLSRFESGNLTLHHQHNFITEPVDPITHESAEYNRVVWQWLSEYDFETVHIRHVAWHSLSFPRLAKLQGANVIFSFHDFYSLCPTVKLLDDQNRYCGGDCTISKTSETDCAPELWPYDSFPILKGQWVHRWREKFNTALRWCDQFVTTHASVRDTLLTYLKLDRERFTVIPHGRDFTELSNLAAPYKNGEPLRILLLGTIHASKGSEIVRKLLEIDHDQLLEFHILGESDITWEHPRLTIHGAYLRDEVAERIAEINPHIGSVFSIWNETWCHTLTELWSVGLPVLALDYPTIGSRIRDNGAGWLVDQSTVEEMTDSKVLLDMVTGSLESVKAKLLSIQQGGLIADSIEQMAQQYMALYKRAINVL